MTVRTFAALGVAFWLAAADAAAACCCTRGTASYYGRWHHGRRMANGHPFNMQGHTAASRTIPLGARVLVTRLDTGRAELVTITDRGPYRHGRLIDLSEGTAERLGFKRQGLARVSVCIVG